MLYHIVSCSICFPKKNKTGEYFCVSSQRCEANFVVLRFLGSRPKAAKLQQDFIELLTPRMSEWINYHPPPSGSNGSHNRNSAFRKIADIFEKKEQSRWKSKDHKCQVDGQYINLHSLSFYVFLFRSETSTQPANPWYPWYPFASSCAVSSLG